MTVDLFAISVLCLIFYYMKLPSYVGNDFLPRDVDSSLKILMWLSSVSILFCFASVQLFRIKKSLKWFFYASWFSVVFPFVVALLLSFYYPHFGLSPSAKNGVFTLFVFAYFIFTPRLVMAFIASWAYLRLSTNKALITSTWVVILVISASILYTSGAMPPWKATNPDDARFDISKFRFEDYSWYDSELTELRKTVLSVCQRDGATEADMDRAFVDAGNAIKVSSQNRDELGVKYVGYRYPHPEFALIDIYSYVDKNDEVIDCDVSGLETHRALNRVPNSSQ